MASDYGLVSTISPPKMNSLLQPALIRFNTEYAKYKRKIESINTGRSDADKITPASIRDCMDAKDLKALCILGEIDGATSIDEATNESVESWFKTALSATPRSLADRIRSAVRSVRYEVSNDDPAGAALTFVLSAVKALDEQNCSEIAQDVDKATTWIDQLENKVEPPFLRKRLRDERKYWSKAEKGSVRHFRNQLSRLANEVQQNDDSRNPSKRSQTQNQPSKPGSSTIKDAQKILSKSEPGSRQDTSPSRNEIPSTSKQGKPWTKKCLNEACGRIHRLKDCTYTSDDLKKQLFEKLYEKRKKRRVSKVRSSDADPVISSDADLPPVPNGSLRPDAKEGRFRIFLEDCTPEIGLGDYGACVNVIGKSTFKAVMKLRPKLAVTILEEPLTLFGAFKNDQDSPVKSDRTIVLSVTIILPGSNVPVRIRGILFHVVSQDMDETYLGRPLLRALGFDLEKHFEKIKDDVHDKELSDIESITGKLASLSYQGLSYQEVDDDPIHLPDVVGAGIGKDTKESIDTAFDRIKADTRENGISEEGYNQISQLLEEYRDIFRIKLGPDPPAKVPPLTITRADNAIPYKSPQRRYAPKQRDFIVRTIKELESVGAVYKNPNSHWASPALAVPKPGSDSLRFTVDLRGPNSRTVPIQSAMPHLESHFQDIEGSKCFANIDLAHGYWQIPLSKESQEMMSIQTPIGVYSSNRLLQGGSDSGNHFQAVIRDKLDGRVEKVLQWLDDFLFFAKNEKELLENLTSFFQVCREVGIKIHPEKTHLFARQANFCGRLVSSDGIQYHPRHFQSLVGMKKPSTAAELQQLLCATNWMRNSILEYSKITAPLHQLMEDAYSKAGKRTKQAVRKISLASEWGAAHEDAFANLKSQLAASVKLAHPRSDHAMCLFTDASDTHWAAILTQVPNDQTRMEIEDQHHSPLCFLSGAFRGASLNWSVPEKEGFAIVEAMCRLDYLIIGHTVSIFTDHANLVYIYDPYGRNPGIPRHTASKLMRWAIKLSAFRYVVEHLPGERNVWADMLTRWAVKSKPTVQVVNLGQIKSMMLAPTNPGIESGLDWPTRQEIVDVQHLSNETPPDRFKGTEDGWVSANDILWIPSTLNSSLENSKQPDQQTSDEKLYKLKLRILIAAHTGIGGHRGMNVTKAAVKAHFYWFNMDKDVERFVGSCLHCLCTQSGKISPRPLGHALHATLPNKLIHFDFCYMSNGEEDKTYVLVIKDDHSGYVWLRPSEAADADTVATCLVEWFAAFGIVSNWVSDRGSHFKNKLIRLISESFKSSHHFTLAYCPWSNGTVEVVCRELLRSTRALLSEFKLPQRCWPSVLPIVQLALNSSKLKRLGDRCPLTVFTSLEPTTPLASITRKNGSQAKVHSIDIIRAKQLMEIERVQSALERMHKEVAELSTKKRQQAVNRHNRRTNVRPCNFDVGDYVLRGLFNHQVGRKPSLKWKGPFKVVECKSEYIFRVEDLLNGKQEDVHGRRLRFFRNKYFEVTEEIKDHLAYQADELFVIDKFKDIRLNNGVVELHVKWKGFSDTENDWVTYDSLKEDVPVLVEQYLQDIRSSGSDKQQQIATTL